MPGDRLGVWVQTLCPGLAWGSGSLFLTGPRDKAILLAREAMNSGSQTFRHLEITQGLKNTDACIPPSENNI